MPKQSGLGDDLFIDGVRIGGDINSVGAVGGGPTVLDVTDITQSAIERRGAGRDGRIEFVSYFSPEVTGTAHSELASLPTTDRLITYCRGMTLSAPAASTVAKQANYDLTRAQDGSLTFAVSAPATKYGVDWGELLTVGVRTDSAAVTGGAGVDYTATTEFGAQAFLHVTSFTGTSVTVKIQHSDDDGAGDPYADIAGLTFAAVTASGSAERLQTDRDLAIKRYIRVVTSGTFTSASFIVAFTKNETEVLF